VRARYVPVRADDHGRVRSLTGRPSRTRRPAVPTGDRLDGADFPSWLCGSIHVTRSGPKGPGQGRNPGAGPPGRRPAFGQGRVIRGITVVRASGTSLWEVGRPRHRWPRPSGLELQDLHKRMAGAMKGCPKRSRRRPSCRCCGPAEAEPRHRRTSRFRERTGAG
jgi:hypothetical protein